MSADVLLCADEGDWFNLYAGNTSRDDLLFVPASVAHPAKQSIALTRRIFEEMEQRGWIAAGSTLVDPFGGRGTAAALWCSRDPRNRALTIECEPHFVELQKKSRDHARRKLGRPLLWKVLRGDSRRCDGLIGGVGWLAALTSPPYGEALHKGSGTGFTVEGFKRPPQRLVAQYADSSYGASASQIGNLPDAALTSPPYGEGVIGKNPQSAEDLIARRPSLKGRNPEGAWFKALEAGYQGKSGANIDHLPEVGAVTSPPYENTPIAPQGADGGEWNRAYREGPEAFKKATRKAAREAGYSVVTSPPYEQSVTDQKPGIDMAKSKRLASGRKDGGASSQVIAGGYRTAGLTSPPYPAAVQDRNGIDPAKFRTNEGRYGPNSQALAGGYGQAGTQIGTTQGETYASAVAQVYAGLARAGVRFVVTVTKNPTRAGKLRRLDLLTKELLERAGYTVVAHRRAWLWMTQAEADKKAGQAGLFEDVAGSERPVGRVSFFKRLGIAKGNVAAQWEDVIFCELAAPVVGSSAPLTSPPYGDTHVVHIDAAGGIGEEYRRGGRPVYAIEKASNEGPRYGTSPGQIGALPDPQDPAP